MAGKPWGNVAQTSAACFVLGMGAWITVNGLYQELPIIAQSAPEGYNIFSYAAVLVALSNIWPAGFVFARAHLLLSREAKWVKQFDHWTTLLTLGLFGVLSCAFLALFYDKTILLGGTQRSVPLFVLIFLSGGVDCMTSVLFYPFVAPFPTLAVTFLIVGEASTGLLAAALAAIQVSAPHFSVGAFFGVLAVVMGASTAAYLWLSNKVPAAKGTLAVNDTPADVLEPAAPTLHLSRRDMLAFLGYQAALAFVENGVHAVLLPHAVRSPTYIQWSVHLSFGGAAVCTLAAHFLPLRARSLPGYAVHGGVAATALITIAAAAVQTAWPPLVTSVIVIVCKCLVAYAKTSGFVQLKLPHGGADKLQGPPHVEDTLDGERLLPMQTSKESPHGHISVDAAYRWGGIGIQVGSCVGAVLFFVLTVVAPVLAQA